MSSKAVPPSRIRSMYFKFKLSLFFSEVGELVASQDLKHAIEHAFCVFILMLYEDNGASLGTSYLFLVEHPY